MAAVIGEGNILDQCLGAATMEKFCPDGQPVLHASGQNSVGGTIGYGSVNATHLAAESGTGNSKLQCLGVGHQPLNDHGQSDVGGSVNGQFGKDGRIGVTGQKGNGSGSGQNIGSGDATGGPTSSDIHPNNKKTFASLFRNSRVPSEASKLTYITPPVGKLVLGFEEIDSVEAAFGYCLVGFVMGPRPSPYTIQNFVKSWNKDVKFTFKDNGWIRFQFPSEEARDGVLNGGPYIISGRQLFLRKMPSCFLFSREDMEFFPSWVQIFGLPADCFTTQALSRIASVVGKPLHTDLLTISKKGAAYARILVELDAKKPRVLEYSVELPTGKEVTIKFKYEFDPKFCDKCGLLGHTSDLCGVRRGRVRQRQPSQKQPSQANIPVHISTEEKIEVAESGSLEDAAESSGTKPGTDKGVDSEQTPQLHYTLEDACLPAPEEAVPGVGLEGDGLGDEDTNYFADSDMHSSFMEECFEDSDDLLDILSTVITQDKEEWKTVKGKIKKGKNKKIAQKKGEGKSGYNDGMAKFFDRMEDMSPCDTKLGPKWDTKNKGNHERKLGKKRIDVVRPPDTASGRP